jgi:simple sugar transport system substrate-binding protein
MTAATGRAGRKNQGRLCYVGPVGDGGWTYEHDQGRKAVVEAFGDKVETDVRGKACQKVQIPERVMTDMALKGR